MILDSLDSSWKLFNQLHSLEQLLKWIKTKCVSLRPKRVHKQIVQHIIVMKKIKVENWKRGTYREHERRIKKRSYLSLSLSPRFRNLALPNIWFPKKTKATVKVTVKCPLFSTCVAPFSPSYVLPIHTLSLSLSLGIFTEIFFIS